MIYDVFIQQLRDNAPVFAGRVAGAAEFYKGLRDYNTSLALPAAFVLPLNQEADSNQIMNGLIQIVHKGVAVAVELDAQQDRRGQAPMMQFELIEQQIFGSCLGLMLGECRMQQPSYFTGARYLDLDRARLFYQWEFGLDWQITDADGWQGDQGFPIESIELDGFHAPGAIGVPGSPPAFVTVIGEAPPPPTDGPWPAARRALSRLFRQRG